MSNHVRIEVEHPHDPTGDVLVIDQWLSYEVESDMFTPVDGFTFRVAPTADYLSFFRDSGHAIRVYYRDNLIMTGTIDATPVNVGDHGPQIELTGRDLAALLFDDAAPLLDLTNQSLRMILEKIIAPHSARIPGIITDNAANRYGLVGRRGSMAKIKALKAAKASPETTTALKKEIAKQRAIRAGRPPIYLPYTLDKRFKSQTQPGETGWSVIERLTKHIGVTAWMTADGWLCVSRPDYEQEAVGKLFTHIDGKGNTTDSNCLMTCGPDTGNRYSDYLCLGQGQANPTSSGKDLAGFTATARDPSRTFWWDAMSRRLQRVKLITVKNTSSKGQLTRFARTKMEETAVKAFNCIATIEGHEVYPGGPLWAVDTMTDVDFQPKEIDAPCLVRRRQFTYDAEAGQVTNLTLIPPIWLAVDHDKLSEAAYFAQMRATFQRYAL